MSEPDNRRAEDEAAGPDRPGKLPITARLVLRESLTARRAAAIIAGVVMLAGIGFLAVITASVTATLVESSRRQFAAGSETDVAQRLDELNDRLARIEAALQDAGPGRSSDGVS